MRKLRPRKVVVAKATKLARSRVTIPMYAVSHQSLLF